MYSWVYLLTVWHATCQSILLMPFVWVLRVFNRGSSETMNMYREGYSEGYDTARYVYHPEGFEEQWRTWNITRKEAYIRRVMRQYNQESVYAWARRDQLRRWERGFIAGFKQGLREEISDLIASGEMSRRRGTR